MRETVDGNLSSRLLVMKGWNLQLLFSIFYFPDVPTLEKTLQRSRQLQQWQYLLYFNIVQTQLHKFCRIM